MARPSGHQIRRKKKKKEGKKKKEERVKGKEFPFCEREFLVYYIIKYIYFLIILTN